jgi:xylulokinase
MAKAVMEGVSFVLRKNCDDIISKGTAIDSIIATGGGAKSSVWCQIQSDITGLPVVVPKVTEAACLGAAMIAAQNDGRYPTLTDAASETVTFVRRYTPNPTPELEQAYRKFCKLYDAMLEIEKL